MLVLGSFNCYNNNTAMLCVLFSLLKYSRHHRQSFFLFVVCVLVRTGTRTVSTVPHTAYIVSFRRRLLATL